MDASWEAGVSWGVWFATLTLGGYGFLALTLLAARASLRAARRREAAADFAVRAQVSRRVREWTVQRLAGRLLELEANARADGRPAERPEIDEAFALLLRASDAERPDEEATALARDGIAGLPCLLARSGAPEPHDVRGGPRSGARKGPWDCRRTR